MSYLNDFKRMAMGRELPSLTEAKNEPLPPDLVKEFLSLANAMSPENLFADGERPKAQAMKLLKTLKARWKELEKKAGRKVTEDEVWGSASSGGKMWGEADMGKAVPGEKLLGHGKPMKGKVMNPENRAALEKLLWGWQTEAEEKAIGKGDNGYVAFYKGKKYEVYGDTLLKARDALAAHLKLPPKKHSDINITLAQKGGKDVVHTPTESRVTESDDAEVAKTIAMQMGGKMKAMLGATLSTAPNGLRIKWPQKKRSLGNVCVVTLRADDTYDMEFFNGDKSVKKFEGIYAEALKPTFEKHTGWYLTL